LGQYYFLIQYGVTFFMDLSQKNIAMHRRFCPRANKYENNRYVIIAGGKE